MRQRRMPFGAEVVEGGVDFALWAPTARDVVVVVDGHEHEASHVGEGWRRALVPSAGAGSRYAFRVDGETVPDPAARFQPEALAGVSCVVDPATFGWTDAAWRGRPWEEAVLYEVHVGTATPDGTFAGLAERLPDLAELGITAIELMPVAAFAGSRNWGYDGVLPFAPDAAYGEPDDLRRLVDRAHGLGISILLDVVYNHFGPVGNYLHRYAASFFTERHQTPWGAGLNFDGAEGGPVREFFIQNALHWLAEYHLDGLRLDAVHAILDDSRPHILEELALRVRAAVPNRQIHLVLENERNEARWLGRDGDGRPGLHDAQWNDDIHHCWHTLLTGERESYYEDYADRPVERLARCLAEGFAYQGEPSRHAGGTPRGEPSTHLPPSAFVAFLQNHDQIGNRAFGERLSRLASAEQLALARAGLLLSPQIPLLFMGEEWAAETPFLFFVDFADDPALSEAVRAGRRREFARFAAFADPAAIPDPTVEDTFRRSVLDPAERQRPSHAAVLADTRELLRLRRERVLPLTRTAFRGASAALPAPAALDVTWRYEGGALRFVANFGEDTVIVGAGDGQALWRSAGVVNGRDGWALPSWTGVFTLGGAP